MWNRLQEFPGFLLFNLRYKSLISSGFERSDWQIVLEEKLYTSLEISHRETILEKVPAATSFFNADYPKGPGGQSKNTYLFLEKILLSNFTKQNRPAHLPIGVQMVVSPLR